MPDWLIVNGARIEKIYFEEQVAETKKYTWEKYSCENELVSHHHCIICSVSVPSAEVSTGETAYKSTGGYLCEYCHDNFYVHGDMA